jgi:hypothetical protein
MRKIALPFIAALSTAALWGAPVNTNDLGVVAAFQNGATVINFDSLSGIQPLSLNAFTNDTPVPNGSLLLQQLQTPGGIGITSGGGIGGVVLNLESPINTAAVSGSGVLGSAFNPIGNNGPQSTCFAANCFLELFFEQGVNRIGFWTNTNVTILASKADVTGVVAQNTVNLENVNGSGLNFVGVERLSDEINFVQIFAGGSPFVIDDLTYGRSGGTTIPEPSSTTFLTLGAALVLVARIHRKRMARTNNQRAGNPSVTLSV